MSALTSTADGSLPVVLGPNEQPMGEISFTFKDLKDDVSLALQGVHPTSYEYRHCFGDKLFEHTSAQGKVIGWTLTGMLRQTAEILERRMIEDIGDYIRHSQVDIEPWIIRCVLLGRSRSRATPYVVLICGSSNCRKALRRRIRQSHYLISPWRCYTLPWNIMPLMGPLGFQPNVTSSFKQYEIYMEGDVVNESIQGWPIEIWNSDNRIGRATIGGIIRAQAIDGRYPHSVDLAITAAHVFGPKDVASSPTLSPFDNNDADSTDSVGSDDENTWPGGDDASIVDSESATSVDTPALSRLSMEPALEPPHPFREKTHIGSLLFMSGMTKELIGQSETSSEGLDWGLIALKDDIPLLQNRAVAALGKSDSHSPGTAVTVLNSPNPTKGSIISSATLGLPGRTFTPQPVMAIRTNSVKPGDSGSWVVRSDVPVVLGMLIGACPLLNEAYYIPFDQILKDVERQMGLPVEIALPTTRRYPSGFLITQSERERDTSITHASGPSLPEILEGLSLKGQYLKSMRGSAFSRSQESTVFAPGESYPRIQQPRTTRLIVAAEEGFIKTVRALLEEGVDIATADDNGTALQHASSRGYIGVVKLLLDKGSDPNATDKYGNTALSSASRNGHAEIVRLLLEAQASNIRNTAGKSPMALAAANRHLDVVALLLEYENDRKLMLTIRGDSLLHMAAADGHLWLAEMLVTKGASLDLDNYDHQTPLHIAAQHSHAEVVQLLVESGANVNRKDSSGVSPLHLVSTADVARPLIEAGADLDSEDRLGNTPLVVASEKGQFDVTNLLLSYGAKPRKRNSKGDTPLHRACCYSPLEVTKLSLDKGADAVATNVLGTTSLHRASTVDHGDVIQLLLDYGADPSSADDLGVCPIHLASHFGNAWLVRLLVKNGADPCVSRPAPPDTSDVGHTWTPIGVGQTPLHMAFEGGHSGVASLLVQLGADLNATDAEGRTPWDMPTYQKRFASSKEFDHLRSQAG